MNLVFLHPHYLFGGNKQTWSAGEAGHDETTVCSGSRATFYRSASASSSVSFSTDVSTLDSSERSADYIYIAGLNLSIAKEGLVNISLWGDDNSDFSTQTEACSQVDIALTDLVGRNNEDFVLEVDSPFTRQYWKALFELGTGSSAFQWEFRSLCFGQFFYFDVEPSAPASQKVSLDYSREYRRNFSLTWTGITNLKLQEFVNKILKHRRYNPVILYARTWDGILNGETLIPTKIVNFELTRAVHNFNKIKVEFEEII